MGREHGKGGLGKGAWYDNVAVVRSLRVMGEGREYEKIGKIINAIGAGLALSAVL